MSSLSESAFAWEQSFPDVLIIALFTDNRGNGSRLIKLIANRYPLSALLKYFSEQFLHTGIRPGVGWSPRETNAEADRLANGDSTGFSPSLRVRVFPQRPPCYVLNEALEMGAQAEEQKKEHRAQQGPGDFHQRRRHKRKLDEKHRIMDPW